MIRKRGESWQVDVTIRNQRVRKSFRCEAQAESLQQRLTEYGLPAAPPKKFTKAATLTQLLHKTHEMRWKGTKSERMAMLNAREVVKLLGEDMPIQALTEEDVRSLIRELELKRISNATINRKMSALSTMLALAKEHDDTYIPPNLERPKVAPYRRRFLSAEEEEGIVGYFTMTERYEPLLLMLAMLYLGLRLKEATRLRWEDVGEEEITVKGLLGRPDRTVPTHPAVHDRLMELKAKGVDPSEPVFGHYGRITWEQALKLAKERVGLAAEKTLITDSFRDTYIFRLALSGLPAMEIQRRAGLKKVKMAMEYIFQAMKEDKGILDRCLKWSDEEVNG